MFHTTLTFSLVFSFKIQLSFGWRQKHNLHYRNKTHEHFTSWQEKHKPNAQPTIPYSQKFLLVIYSPYLTRHISPTTISPTGIWTTSPPRITLNWCSCSILACNPRNCFSFCQSLKAVTKTTTTTAIRIATPSIQPASLSWSVPLSSEMSKKIRLSCWPHSVFFHVNTMGSYWTKIQF